jgi:phosphomannomutase
MKISISGIRGIYGSDLITSDIVKFVRLFASLIIKDGGQCVIARDTRPSSRIIIQIVSAGLREQGVDVYDLGVAPTPVVFLESRKYGYGIVVTASHNPLEWNGLKFIVKGRGIFQNELNQITSEEISNFRLGKFGICTAAVSNYVDEVLSLITKQTGKSNSVGLDLGGGAACYHYDKLFKRLGHTFYSINDVPGLSSRGPDPTVADLTELQMLVKLNQLDFGFAYDLDADRVVVVDSYGHKLNADTTVLFCIANAIEAGMKRFVASIDTSLAVEEYVKKNGGKFVYSKVGEVNVVDTLLQTNSEAGGEGSSGGFIMPKFNMCRDGFLASAMISSSKSELIEQCLHLSSRYQQIRSKIYTAASADVHNRVFEKLNEVLKPRSSELLTIDGVKATIDDNSWVLLRVSNTENALRISVESKPENVCSLYKEFKDRVQDIYDQIK